MKKKLLTILTVTVISGALCRVIWYEWFPFETKVLLTCATIAFWFIATIIEVSR